MAEVEVEVEAEIPKVKSILVYPIKSCRGISVPQATVSSTGFRWDRLWLVVNSKGRAYTQRVEPKLALVVVQLPDEAFKETTWEPNNTSYMVIKAPGMDALKVPLVQPADIINGVSMWEWSGSAIDEGPEAAKWFSDYLQKPSRLVRFNNAHEVRNVDPNYASGYQVMFTDLFPFLLLSQESLDTFNTHLEKPVSVDRFRPNILVDGCEPFAEDLWTEIKINELTFHGVKLCSRCKIPTIDQETGEASGEVSEALKKYRSDKVVRPNKKHQQGKVYFGKNLVCTESLSQGTKGKTIKVGDPIYVLKTLSSAADAPV